MSCLGLIINENWRDSWFGIKWICSGSVIVMCMMFTICVQYYTTGKASTFSGFGCDRNMRHSTLATGTCIKCDESMEMLYRRWYCPYTLHCTAWDVVVFICFFFLTPKLWFIGWYLKPAFLKQRKACLNEYACHIMAIINAWPGDIAYY